MASLQSGDSAFDSSRQRFLGVDLAWSARNGTGVATVDDAGALVGSAVVGNDAELDAWIDAHVCSEHVVAAIDAPLIVTNLGGSRTGEKELTKVFGPYQAGCYPTNLGMTWMNPPRGGELAKRHGWNTDLSVDPRTESVALEVYPHAAMVALFSLPRTLKYKPGRGRTVADRAAALAELMAHLQVIPSLDLEEKHRWRELTELVMNVRRPVDLKRAEDEIDAILCAYLAWLWVNDRQRFVTYGTVEEGFVVTPRLLDRVAPSGSIAPDVPDGDAGI